MPTAQFAPIAPSSLTLKLDRLGILGDYHMLLAHDVLVYTATWETFYENLKEDGRIPFKILDNSLVEMGEPLGAESLSAASLTVGASCIVLPDKQHYYAESARLSVDSAYELSRQTLPGNCTFMGVVQGNTIKELMECAQRLSREVTLLEYLAVPRVVTNTIGSRVEIVRRLSYDFPYRIHLLGWSDNIVDDFETLKHVNVMGIDSAAPIYLGQHKKILPGRIQDATWLKYWYRPKDYFSSHQLLQPETVVNLFRVREWLSKAGRIPYSSARTC